MLLNLAFKLSAIRQSSTEGETSLSFNSLVSFLVAIKLASLSFPCFLQPVREGTKLNSYIETSNITEFKNEGKRLLYLKSVLHSLALSLGSWPLSPPSLVLS